MSIIIYLYVNIAYMALGGLWGQLLKQTRNKATYYRAHARYILDFL